MAPTPLTKDENRYPVQQSAVGSAANAAVAITFPAKPGFRHMLTNLLADYDVTPAAAGTVVIEGADTVGEVDVEVTVVVAGTIPIMGWNLYGLENTAMVITLGAGGGGVTGRLTAQVVEKPV
jgi:hypothetical protein